MNKIKIFTDGGSRGNPGEAAIGVVIFKDDSIVAEISKCIGVATNNIAEYMAVEEALLFASKELNLQEKEIEFFLDSELVQRQLTGVYKIKDEKLKKIYLRIRELISNLDLKAEFNHVTRDKNKLADKLVNLALDQKL